ncbi:MAG: hypothetical protein ABI700_10440 [Chloroflexota bacterium]
MPKISLRWLIVGAGVIVFVLIVVLFVRDAQTPITPVAQPLTQTFDKSPTGFTMKYPADWNYFIPTIGVFVLAPEQTPDDKELVPTFTIQRAEPISITGTLDNALDRYLQNGPLHTPGHWQVTNAIQTVQIDGRDARQVEIEGADTPGSQALHTKIVVTASNNTFVYFLSTTVPASKRATFEPTLDAMLKTVHILE